MVLLQHPVSKKMSMPGTDTLMDIRRKENESSEHAWSLSASMADKPFAAAHSPKGHNERGGGPMLNLTDLLLVYRSMPFISHSYLLVVDCSWHGEE